MKQYPKYKDSGIQWIGQIPEGWKVQALKYIGDARNGLTYSPLDVTDAGILVLRSSNIQDSKLAFKDNVYVKEAPDFLKMKKGDIIICSRNGSLALVGKCVYIPEDMDAVFGAFMLRYRPHIPNRFIFYVVQEAIRKYKAYYATSTVNQLTVDVLGRMQVPLPPISEQESIVRYLDDKTAKIDETVNLLEQQKTDLQQYRKALISKTVTRGLNPNAKLKDSGIQWIGQIPEEWETSRIKDIIDMRSGINLPSEKILSQGKYPVYGGNGIRGYYLEYSNEGDFILIGRQGALCGNINYASGRFWATEHAVVCYPKKNLALKWLGELLRTMNLGQYSISAAQPGLSMERIKNLPIPLPPISEQQAIADFLDSKTATIDQSIANIETQIADLRAYRAALISDVVTGKIDVRN